MNLAVTNNSGIIRFISESQFRKIHDNAIWDDIEFQFNHSTLFVDPGFKGVGKVYINVRIPHKKKENKEIGRTRIMIEQAFGRVKTLKIIKNKIRLNYYKKDIPFSESHQRFIT